MSTKSPLKYKKDFTSFGGVLGFLYGLFILAVLYFVGPVAPTIGSAIFFLITMTAIFTAVGYGITRQYGTIFTYEVDHPVNLNNLIPSHTYWLNGETAARFIGVNSFSGKYHFHIEGYNSETNRDDFTAIYPGMVRKYISMKQEPH